MQPMRRGARIAWLPLMLTSLIVAGALGLGGWYYWTGTVYYSLQQLHHAISHQNRYLFEKHVDLEHMTRRAVDDLLEIELAELKKTSMGFWEQLTAQLGVAFVQLLKPRLVDEVRFAIIRGVESGALERGELRTEPRPSRDEMDTAVGELTDDFPKLKPVGRGTVRMVHREGGTATLELPIQLDDDLPEASPTQTLRVRLVRTPDRYWRATEVENAKEMFQLWNERQEKRLELANQPIRQMIKTHVTVVDVSKQQSLNAYGTGKDAWVVVTLKNHASSALQGLVADVTVSDAGGELKRARVQDVEPIPPGETRTKWWALNLDLSDNVDRLIYETGSSQLVIAVDVRHLAFSDGRSIKIAESLDEVEEKPGERRPSAPPVEFVQGL